MRGVSTKSIRLRGFEDLNKNMEKKGRGESQTTL